MIDRKINIFVISLIIAIVAVPVIFSRGLGNGDGHSIAVPMPTPAGDKPPYAAYKGVEIGATTDDARAKLGAPKDKSAEQDYFEFSANESAQVYYDAAHKVTAITVTYNGKLDSAPTAKAVFGEDAEAKPDGAIFKMERFPKAGFWISYTKTGGDDAIIMIAMQKM